MHYFHKHIRNCIIIMMFLNIIIAQGIAVDAVKAGASPSPSSLCFDCPDRNQNYSYAIAASTPEFYWNLEKIINSFYSYIEFMINLIGDLLFPKQVDPNYDAVGTVLVEGILPFDANGTGTLITDNLVLTAGHCICTDNPGNTTTPTCYKFGRKVTFYNVPLANNTSIRQDITINGTARVAPCYGDINKFCDVAVIQLEEPVSNIANVEPIPLETPQKYSVKKGDQLTAVGFGNTGGCCQEEIPYPGRKVDTIPVMHVDEARGDISSDGTKHLCGGDSGGPALNAEGHIVGVASIGCTQSYNVSYNTSSCECKTNISSTNESYSWILTGN